jgi:hypothetical protein
MIRDEHLARCSECFEENEIRFEELAARVSQQQANWQPAPGRWSVAECVEHLNITIEQYFDRMEPAFSRARQQGQIGTGPWKKRTLLGRLILRVLDPEAERSFPAPKVFKPSSAEDLEFADVRKRFRTGTATLLTLARQADGLDLDRVRFTSPAGPILRLTAAEAFEIHVLHIPRHLAQAEAVTRRPDYPA